MQKRHGPKLPKSRIRRRLVTTYLPACDGNAPGRPLMSLCSAALTKCADPDETWVWEFQAQIRAGSVSQDDWHSTGRSMCRGPANPPNKGITFTAKDFRRLPLPAEKIEIQPDTRQTLVNVPTDLFVTTNTVMLQTTILRQRVQVSAEAVQFQWNYGDGYGLKTKNPGGPYPVLDTAHIYRTAGTVTLNLTTTYTGKYSVAGGPWRNINGTASVASPTVQIVVVQAEGRLVTPPAG